MSLPTPRLPYATPFVLQLAYDLADFKLVRAHWTKNFRRRFGPTEPVHALMDRVLHQIRADGYVLRASYVFPLEEVTTHSEETTREQQAHCALIQLGSVSFQFEMPTQRRFHCRPLLDGSAEFPSHYTSTGVTVIFSRQLRSYLLNVAQLDELFPSSPQ